MNTANPKLGDERQQAPGRQVRGRAFKARAGLTGLDNSMLHRGRNQASDRQHHQRKRGADQKLRGSGKHLERVLENALKQESEQYLRAQDQETGFVQRYLYSSVQLHSSNSVVCTGALSDGN